MAKLMVSEGVRGAIEDVLRTELEGCGVTYIHIEVANDHTGDESIFVTIDYDSNGESVDIGRIAGLTTKVRDRLWAAGEERFVYIHNNFAESDEEDSSND